MAAAVSPRAAASANKAPWRSRRDSTRHGPRPRLRRPRHRWRPVRVVRSLLARRRRLGRPRVEKKHFPREKTCGDGLTPRSVRQLYDMGLAGALPDHHRYDGLRSVAFGRELELPWPAHPDYPTHGYASPAPSSTRWSATRPRRPGPVWQGAEAVAPLEARHVEPPAARSALGAATGRSCSTTRPGHTRGSRPVRGRRRRRELPLRPGARHTRDRSVPLGMAHPRLLLLPPPRRAVHRIHLDIRDKDGQRRPRLRLGLPARRRPGERRRRAAVDLRRLEGREHHQADGGVRRQRPDVVGLDPRRACGPPTGGRLPMGLSVGRASGRRTSSSATPAVSINPFNGEGIAYGYETGRLAAGARRRWPAGASKPSTTTRPACRTPTACTTPWRGVS